MVTAPDPDKEDELKIPSVFDWRKIRKVTGIVALILLMLVVLGMIVSAVRQHYSDKRGEVFEALRKEEDALKLRVRPRLERLHQIVRDDSGKVGDAKGCLELSQPEALVLIQWEWLDFKFDPPPEPERIQLNVPLPHPKVSADLNSDVYNFFIGRFSGPGVEGSRRYQAQLGELAVARYIAVYRSASFERARPAGGVRFEGGSVSGELLVVGMSEGEVLCRERMVSQAGFAFYLEQPGGPGGPAANREAQARALAQSTKFAFWKAVKERLVVMAPKLALDEPRP